jgi:hypothetical protein
VTNFNENWRFENFVETSQCTITRELFKQFSNCYLQTDLRTGKVKKINGFLYLFAENVSDYWKDGYPKPTDIVCKLSTSLSFENAAHIKNGALVTSSVVDLK